jgi:hypothetical protein
MPGDTESYRGYEIVWDVHKDVETGLWKSQAGVVVPAGPTGINKVHGIARESDDFSTYDDARAWLLDSARAWIDNRLEREQTESRA